MLGVSMLRFTTLTTGKNIRLSVSSTSGSLMPGIPAIAATHVGLLKSSLGHTNVILCCSGEKTFQTGSVGRLNNDNNSHVIPAWLPFVCG